MEVLLLKGSRDDMLENDPYIHALIGYDVTVIPVLDFSYDQSAIQELSSGLEVVLVTSPRPVHALVKYAPPTLQRDLSKAVWYVVGPKTAEAVRRFLPGVEPRGEQCGNAETLVEFVQTERLNGRRILFLCGDLRRPTVEEAFKGYTNFRSLVIYHTIINKALKLPECPPPKKRVCVFFSPSGVEAALTMLTPFDAIVAIGETTANAVRLSGRPLSAIAPHPSPAGVADAIRSLGLPKS